ncbi:membrane hypothetical protein [Mesorhizobium escarrei]|uniref:NfeD integral membrane domain-containing protein n=1 Tax=Mesorhizobium escarrei TaxID=666018 RepID=A0ABN8JK51_9HYPH|nr:membrane hypothetical protein [Mesorhizobium escarrei]
MIAKATNDAVALIRSLAELRGRNADWGEKAVREAASLSASAALQERVVDFVARDTTELLQLADGRTVEIAGRKEVLATKGLPVETLEPGWLIRLLAVITDPNIAVILMLIGVYGLVFEFTSPGAVAPGVIGTICLLLGLYALNHLPISYAGLALMLLGIIFLVVEVFNPTVVLGLGGVAAFLLGSAMLLRIEGPGFEMSWPVIGTAAVLTLGLALLTGSYLWAGRKKRSACWRTGHARAAGQGPRLGGQRGPRACPGRALAGKGRRTRCSGRQRRGGRCQGSRADDTAPQCEKRRSRAMIFGYVAYLVAALVVVMFLSAAIRIRGNISAV